MLKKTHEPVFVTGLHINSKPLGMPGKPGYTTPDPTNGLPQVGNAGTTTGTATT
ncbi:MAG: hypothetical protein RBR37_01595 [Advenella sp.]|nr:hypothetical protein [Advenella sp.]